MSKAHGKPREIESKKKVKDTRSDGNYQARAAKKMRHGS